MKNQVTRALKAAAILAAFALVFLYAQAQPTQGWTRDAAVHVTSTATIANTDLRGTVTDGWDKIVVHNKDTTDWVGTQPVANGRQALYTAAAFNTMTVFIPPNGSVVVEDEDIIRLRHITDTGTSADLIIERHERQ